MPVIEGSQSTQFTSWSARSGMSCSGGVPAAIFFPVRFMYTSQRGGLSFGSASFRAASNFSLAGCMSFVWKPPDVFSILACRQPSVAFTFVSRRWTAANVPAQEKPFGNKKLATWHTSEGASMLSAQSLSRTSWFRPATESIACWEASAASCIASPRSFTTFSPVSKSKTPATVSAVYSPKERPATAWQRFTLSGWSALSFSIPASPATYIAGWQNLVRSNSASGPLRQTSSKSKSRILFAVASMSLTAGRSLTPAIIFTYCDPWPGKSSATGSELAAESGGGRAAGADEASAGLFGWIGAIGMGAFFSRTDASAPIQSRVFGS
mmetsp:Transcript_43430/g.80941  ORF Transcript_43430/g.80941 Transcript_43430/m.80941 type:complete len:324 (+) Transcript_43430:435-1406(+)